jgi:hypothetical protein
VRNSPSFQCGVDHGHFSIELHTWCSAESCTFATFIYAKGGERLLQQFTSQRSKALRSQVDVGSALKDQETAVCASLARFLSLATRGRDPFCSQGREEQGTTQVRIRCLECKNQCRRYSKSGFDRDFSSRNEMRSIWRGRISLGQRSGRTSLIEKARRLQSVASS